MSSFDYLLDILISIILNSLPWGAEPYISIIYLLSSIIFSTSLMSISLPVPLRRSLLFPVSVMDLQAASKGPSTFINPVPILFIQLLIKTFFALLSAGIPIPIKRHTHHVTAIIVPPKGWLTRQILKRFIIWVSHPLEKILKL